MSSKSSSINKKSIIRKRNKNKLIGGAWPLNQMKSSASAISTAASDAATATTSAASRAAAATAAAATATASAASSAAGTAASAAYDAASRSASAAAGTVGAVGTAASDTATSFFSSSKKSSITKSVTPKSKKNMIKSMIETNKLYNKGSPSNNYDTIIDSSFAVYNNYSKKVIHNIISNILNKETISDDEYNIINKILQKIDQKIKDLKSQKINTLIYYDTLMFIIDKVYLFDILSKRKNIIDSIKNEKYEGIEIYISLYNNNNTRPIEKIPGSSTDNEENKTEEIKNSNNVAKKGNLRKAGMEKKSNLYPIPEGNNENNNTYTRPIEKIPRPLTGNEGNKTEEIKNSNNVAKKGNLRKAGMEKKSNLYPIPEGNNENNNNENNNNDNNNNKVKAKNKTSAAVPGNTTTRNTAIGNASIGNAAKLRTKEDKGIKNKMHNVIESPENLRVNGEYNLD